jgi:hypothetical protein
MPSYKPGWKQAGHTDLTLAEFFHHRRQEIIEKGSRFVAQQ